MIQFSTNGLLCAPSGSTYSKLSDLVYPSKVSGPMIKPCDELIDDGIRDFDVVGNYSTVTHFEILDSYRSYTITNIIDNPFGS